MTLKARLDRLEDRKPTNEPICLFIDGVSPDDNEPPPMGYKYDGVTYTRQHTEGIDEFRKRVETEVLQPGFDLSLAIIHSI